MIKKKYICKCGKPKEQGWGICKTCNENFEKEKEKKVENELIFARKKVQEFNLVGLVKVKPSWKTCIHLECESIKDERYGNAMHEYPKKGRKFEFEVVEFLIKVSKKINELNREYLKKELDEFFANHDNAIRFRSIREMINHREEKWTEGENA